MTRLCPAITRTIALSLLLGAIPLTGAAAQSRQPTPGNEVVRKGLAQIEDKQKNNPAVEAVAVDALKRMSTYLGTLKSFEVKADTTLDLVLMSGQRVQLGGATQYKVRRPDGFQINVETDLMKRRFYFDGKQFTIFSPELGFYATAAAPPTIREALDVIYEKFYIALPLEDLFQWSDPDSKRPQKLTSAFMIGPATVDGVATDHYALREGMHDWEIWIQQGDKPLPRKLVIVDRSDKSLPAYVARLTWTENAALVASDFTYQPGADAKLISLAGQ